MNERQKRFCDEYLKDLNGTQAAIRAGYSAKTATVIANENLRKPYIKAYIEEKQKELADKNLITKEELIKDLIKIKTICSTPDDKGKIDSSGATKAIDILNKMIGGYEEDNKQKCNIDPLKVKFI